MRHRVLYSTCCVDDDAGWSRKRVVAVFVLALLIVNVVYLVGVRLHRVQPLVTGVAWVVLGLVSFRYFKPRLGSHGVVDAVAVSLLHVGFIFLYGFIVGFGLNAMSPSPGLMFYTLAWVAATAFGREIVRSAGLQGSSFRSVLLAYLWGIVSWYPLLGLLATGGSGFLGSFLEAVNRVGFVVAGEIVASMLAWLYGWAASGLYVVTSYGLFTWFPLIPAGTALGRSLAFASASAMALAFLYARGVDRGGGRYVIMLYTAVIVSVWIVLGSTGILGFYVFALGSSSMEPALKPGDIILVRKVSLNDVRLGDIIAYENPENDLIVVHRVVALGDGYLVAKGDMNGEPDPLNVTAAMLLGKVVARIPLLGYLARGVPLTPLGHGHR